MDGESFEILTVAVPAAVGVGVVIATVVLVFWIGAGRQTSYEDAMKAARGRAEEVVRKMAEKEKEQKQKKEKKRPGERKRRQEGGRQEGGRAGSQVEVETTPKLLSTQKGILKSSKQNSVAKDKVSPCVHVLW